MLLSHWTIPRTSPSQWQTVSGITCTRSCVVVLTGASLAAVVNRFWNDAGGAVFTRFIDENVTFALETREGGRVADDAASRVFEVVNRTNAVVRRIATAVESAAAINVTSAAENEMKKNSDPSLLQSVLLASGDVVVHPPSETIECAKVTVLLRVMQSNAQLSLTVLSCPVLSCPVLSCPVLSCPVLSCPVLSCPVLSCPVLSCPVMSCPVLPCPVLPCPVLPCSAMSL
jgi:hypothetical protein